MSSSFAMSGGWRTFVARARVLSECGAGSGVLRVWCFCFLSLYTGVR